LKKRRQRSCAAVAAAGWAWENPGKHVPEEQSMVPSKPDFPRCQIVPLPDQRASFQIDGREKTRWIFTGAHPRPCFFPLNGPSGESLTRMGHPGAPNHDHHQSVWFAHNKVLGIDFWSNNSTARIEQTEWLAYQDGDDEAVMGVKLAWRDGHEPRPLLEQELVVAIAPLNDEQWTMELQSRFTPSSETLEFQKTNFGFFAVRVAKRIAEFFGSGTLTNSKGATGERAIFGKPSRWMDYSGPARDGGTEGVSYLDHSSNPGQPMRWHVREDGWMGASPCMLEPLQTSRTKPLILRHMLFLHRGGADAKRINEQAARFVESQPWEVVKPTTRHTHAVIRRVSS